MTIIIEKGSGETIEINDSFTLHFVKDIGGPASSSFYGSAEVFKKVVDSGLKIETVGGLKFNSVNKI